MPDTSTYARPPGSPIFQIRCRGAKLLTSTCPARTAVSSSSSRAKSGTCLRISGLHAILFLPAENRPAKAQRGLHNSWTETTGVQKTELSPGEPALSEVERGDRP